VKSQEIKSQLRELVPDFAEKVASIYKLLGWEWQPKEVCFVPTEVDVTRTLYRMINDMDFEEGEGNLSTGGLTVFSEPPNICDTCWNIGLRFELKHVAIIGNVGRSIFASGKR